MLRTHLVVIAVFGSYVLCNPAAFAADEITINGIAIGASSKVIEQSVEVICKGGLCCPRSNTVSRTDTLENIDCDQSRVIEKLAGVPESSWLLGFEAGKVGFFRVEFPVEQYEALLAYFTTLRGKPGISVADDLTVPSLGRVESRRSVWATASEKIILRERGDGGTTGSVQIVASWYFPAMGARRSGEKQ